MWIATTARNKHWQGKVFLTLLLAMSLLVVTSSRIASITAFAKTEVAYAQFLSAGGSIADLCRDGNVPHPGSAACDACRLVDLAALPAVITQLIPLQFPEILGLSLPQSCKSETRFINPAAPARGPPMFA